MILLKKGECPQVLKENAAQWLDQLKAAIAQGEPEAKIKRAKGRYNHPDVKSSLMKETNGKCAYCESDPRHVDYGDIEHIVPKKVDLSKTFDWNNLTIACGVCNNNKGAVEELIDPYSEDPQNEFEFIGPMIWHKWGRDRAHLTHVRLDLNRTALLERRREKAENILTNLENLDKIVDQNVKMLLREAVIASVTADKAEFAAMARSLAAVR